MRMLVLFTCYNRKEKTLTCIETLMADKNQQFTFLVVDDNSSDGTLEILEGFSNVEVINAEGNLFYSGGMRLAIAEAKKRNLEEFDYVILVNDDVKFYNLAISQLIDYLNQEQSIIVGTTCDDKGRLSYGGVKKCSKWRPIYKNVISGEKRVYCDTFCANCVIIPTKIFKSLDNIDPVYRHAMGDFDYGCNARKSGVPILASNFFVGVCNDNPKDNTWRDSKLPIVLRIQKKESPKGLPTKEWFYYLKKNHNIFTAVLYSISPYIKILLRK